jgi:hypothetical protein
MIFTKEQLPSDIDTVEQVFVWASLLLDNQAGTIDVKEDDAAIPSPAVQVAIIRMADDTKRIIGRCALQLNPNYAQDNSVKLWKHVLPIVNTTTPVSFTTN